MASQQIGEQRVTVGVIDSRMPFGFSIKIGIQFLKPEIYSTLKSTHGNRPIPSCRFIFLSFFFSSFLIEQNEN